MSARLTRPFLNSLRPAPRRSTLGEASSLRPEVCPPSLVNAPAGWWERTLFRLLNPTAGSTPTVAELQGVRLDFVAEIADLPTGHLPTADGGSLTLQDRIAQTRSLRELWHLRMAVYTHIATEHSQGEAERRLERLNRHFLGRR